MTAVPRGNPASRLVSLASLCLAAAAADPAGAQIHGSLEKLIVELPNGCSTRSTATQPGGSGTFSFSYACSDQHDVVFTVSFPATVEAKSFDGSFYHLDESAKANASASASWTWKTPANPPGGLFQSSSLRLYLGTYGSSAPCAAPEVIKLWLAPGTSTSDAALPCALSALAAWSSGEPGDTVPWASYWAEAQFNAFYSNLSAVFASQRARARAVYRMEIPPADLDVDLFAERTFVNTQPSFNVRVWNGGEQAAIASTLVIEIASGLLAGKPTTEPPSRCTWQLFHDTARGDCPLPSIAPDNGDQFIVHIPLEASDLNKLVRTTAEIVPGDSNPANDVAKLVQEYIFCSEPGSANLSDPCVVLAIACLGEFHSAAPTGSAVLPAVRAWQSLAALATSPIDVASFQRLRDEIMAESAAGRRLAALYDEHTAEIVSLAVTHADLLAALVDGVLLWQPHVQALVDGDGSAVITAEQVASLEDVLARLKALGSPALRARILREEAALDLPWFVGRTMAQARTLAEATSLRRRLPAAGS